jgi:AraC family transcriptional regulator
MACFTCLLPKSRASRHAAVRAFTREVGQMSEDGVLAALPWGADPGTGGGGSLSAGSQAERVASRDASPTQRVLHLVKRAILALGSDHQGARRCLDDALTVLGLQKEEATADGPLGHFQPGGLARWQARRAIAYIDTHLESGLDVPILAKLVSFSKSHFSRAFKQSLGLPPMMYVKMRRIERAKALMISTDQQLSEIAIICGFADQSHFNRSFRKAIGVSPGRWRRTIQMRARSHSCNEGLGSPRASDGLAAGNGSSRGERVGC